MRRLEQATEHQEQAALIQWVDIIPRLKGLVYAVPNGGLRNKTIAAKLKAEGVRRGIPDIAFDESEHGYHGLRIELKTKKGGLTLEQREWLKYLNKNGYYGVWCRGAAEAIEVFKWYIGILDIEPEKRKI